MRAGHIERIETAVQRVAAASVGGAVAFAAFSLLRPVADEPGRGAFTAAAAFAAYVLCARLLNRVDAATGRFPVRAFDVGAIEQAAAEQSPAADSEPPADEPLVLDDILAEIGPDARVVRLFDPAAMPTPGQLRARIDRHLEDCDPTAGLVDASQALYDALAELRRSLR